METKIHVISIQESYLTIISKQLELIFGDKAIVSKLLVKDLDGDSISKGDLVLLSRSILTGVIRPFIPKECKTIVARREVNIANSKQLIDLPPGRKLLIVNDTLENAQETMDSLKNIFFKHTYFLDGENDTDRFIPEDIDYIVTPGEMEFVPSRYSNVIDIGDRLVSYGSVWEIAEALNARFTHEQLVNRYVNSKYHLLSQATLHLTPDRMSMQKLETFHKMRFYLLTRKLKSMVF